MLTVKRNLTRQSSEIDYRTRKPIVVQLAEGGKLIRLRPLGTRTWYVVTIKQVFNQGAANRAQEIKAEKKARKLELQEARNSAGR